MKVVSGYMDYSKWDKLDYDSDEELCKPRGDDGTANVGQPASAKQTLNRAANFCWTCYSPGAGLRCGKCKQVFFCGRECQQRGWRRHKFQCRGPGDVASHNRCVAEFDQMLMRSAEDEDEGQEDGPGGQAGPARAMAEGHPASRVREVPPNRPDLSLAVIIPFRQQLPLQNRGPHLEQVVAHLHGMFGQLAGAGWLERWRLLVVEQAQDGRPFNRGALLDAGFDFLDTSGEAFDQVVLHDADLLPADEATELWYTAEVPQGHVVHLTAQGYAKCGQGSTADCTAPGVVMLRWSDFKASNGFPLDVWGWAACLEDHVWFDRLGYHGMRYFPCPVGAWRDLDSVDLAVCKEALADPEPYYDRRWLLHASGAAPHCGDAGRGAAGPAPPPEWELAESVYDRRGGLDTPGFYHVLRQGPCLRHATLVEVALRG